MQAQLGAMTLPFCGHPFEKAIRGVAEAGFRHVCIGLPHQHHFVPHPNDDDAKLRLLADACIRRMLQPVMLFCLCHAEHENGQQTWFKTLHQAAILQIPYILGLGTWSFKDPHNLIGGKKSHAHQADEEARWIAAMQPVCDQAATLGITILVKPHTGNTATALECLHLIRTMHHPALGICYDPGNVHFYEGVDPVADLPLIVEHVRAVCLKDHLGTRFHADFPPPGEGAVNFPALFEILRKNKFHGPMLVERVDGALVAGNMPCPDIVVRLQRARSHIIEAAKKAGLELTA